MPINNNIKPKKGKFNKEDRPYGDSLLSRDKPENREKWGPDGVGYEPIQESICDPDTGKCPYYHYRKDAERPEATQTKIHMLIASFRDRLCPRTLHNAFQHAENPHRVYIRIIEQTEPGSDLLDDAKCWERYCQEYNTNCQEFETNVRVFAMDSTNSKGPTDARSKLSAMIAYDYQTHGQDLVSVGLQDYCMQIDSHMDFSDNYDTELVLMHHRTQNDYAVLSTYVADIVQNNQDIRVVPNLCMVTFTSTIRNWGTKECRHLLRPKLTNAMWGAGLSFHRCHAELNVPVDPYLDNVFDGEEGSRGIRFFTHGYDVYTPDRVLVTHDYHNHQGNPVVHTWGKHKNGGTAQQAQDNNHKDYVYRQQIEESRKLVKTQGVGRVNMLLGIGTRTKPEDLQEVKEIRSSRYGIGTKRSLEQVRQFTGIDLEKRKMVENKCGNLLWVPYEEDTLGGGDDSSSPKIYTYGVPQTLARGLVGQEGDDTGIDVSSFFVNTSGSGSGNGKAATATANHLRLGGGSDGGGAIADVMPKNDTTSPTMLILLGGCCGALILWMIASRLGKRQKNTKHN